MKFELIRGLLDRGGTLNYSKENNAKLLASVTGTGIRLKKLSCREEKLPVRVELQSNPSLSSVRDKIFPKESQPAGTISEFLANTWASTPDLE